MDEELRELERRADDDPHRILALAQALHRAGRSAEAVEAFHRALVLGADAAACRAGLRGAPPSPWPNTWGDPGGTWRSSAKPTLKGRVLARRPVPLAGVLVLDQRGRIVYGGLGEVLVLNGDTLEVEDRFEVPGGFGSPAVTAGGELLLALPRGLHRIVGRRFEVAVPCRPIASAVVAGDVTLVTVEERRDTRVRVLSGPRLDELASIPSGSERARVRGDELVLSRGGWCRVHSLRGELRHTIGAPGGALVEYLGDGVGRFVTEEGGDAALVDIRARVVMRRVVVGGHVSGYAGATGGGAFVIRRTTSSAEVLAIEPSGEVAWRAPAMLPPADELGHLVAGRGDVVLYPGPRGLCARTRDGELVLEVGPPRTVPLAVDARGRTLARSLSVTGTGELLVLA